MIPRNRWMSAEGVQSPSIAIVWFGCVPGGDFPGAAICGGVLLILATTGERATYCCDFRVLLARRRFISAIKYTY